MARGAVASPAGVLRRELRALRWPAEWMRERGLVYRGPADFVLEHGEWFAPRPLTEGAGGYRIGLPGHCYANAIQVAVQHGLDYVEGFALGGKSGGLPIHHAWNSEPDGGLVDTTWTGTRALARVFEGDGIKTKVFMGAPGTAYLGVRFAVERADDCTWNGEANVLDDHRRGWPLLREPWTGEPTGLGWHGGPSEHLAILVALRDEGMEAARDRYGELLAGISAGGVEFDPGAVATVVDALSKSSIRPG